MGFIGLAIVTDMTLCVFGGALFEAAMMGEFNYLYGYWWANSEQLFHWLIFLAALFQPTHKIFNTNCVVFYIGGQRVARN